MECDTRHNARHRRRCAGQTDQFNTDTARRQQTRQPSHYAAQTWQLLFNPCAVPDFRAARTRFQSQRIAWSGLFLVAERPFSAGDIIRVGTTTGEVLSVDLLAVKLRTFDNLFVRIPNESLIKSEVTTLTRFPIRRLDVLVGVAYKEDLNKVRSVLDEVAYTNPLCLEEPKPLYIFQGFGESSLDIQFSVWAKRENFLDLRNSIYQEIKSAFDEHGIEIPFPHRTLYTGSVTTPFPIQSVDIRD